VVMVVKPWARYSARKAMAADPTMATASGSRPSSTAGRMNSRMTPKLAARPARAARPRSLPRITTATAKMSASHTSSELRSRSKYRYRNPSSAAGSYASRTRSPGASTGVVGETTKSWDTSRPAPGPSVSWKASRRQDTCPGAWPGHGASVTASTRAS
jgi:hypothetical protein